MGLGMGLQLLDVLVEWFVFGSSSFCLFRRVGLGYSPIALLCVL